MFGPLQCSQESVYAMVHAIAGFYHIVCQSGWCASKIDIGSVMMRDGNLWWQSYLPFVLSLRHQSRHYSGHCVTWSLSCWGLGSLEGVPWVFQVAPLAMIRALLKYGLLSFHSNISTVLDTTLRGVSKLFLSSIFKTHQLDFIRSSFNNFVYDITCTVVQSGHRVECI